MKVWIPALGLIGIGFYIAGCIIGGILGGVWLDEQIHTEPAFLITGIILGVAVAYLGVYFMVKPLLDSTRKGGKYS